MRWPPYDPSKPHLWFAWRPVRVEGQWVWLEYVIRQWNWFWKEWGYSFGTEGSHTESEEVEDRRDWSKERAAAQQVFGRKA